MKKDKIPRNAKGQPHGVWEQYWNNGELAFKCVYINGNINGFDELYDWYGKPTEKNYYL